MSMATSTSNTNQHFRLLHLPNELRLKIYGFILPRNEKIFLDPRNIYRPLPYIHTSYDTTFNFLQLNKQIHAEATQYIYNNNVVNIIQPLEAAPGDFLLNLGVTACRYLRALECHIRRDLSDLGAIWRTMHTQCPSLEELRLVFYHDRYNWGYTATSLVHKVMNASTAVTNDGTPQHDVVIQLDLYDSIWHHALYAAEVPSFFNVATAAKRAQGFPLSLPKTLKKIIVTASVQDDVDHAFISRQLTDLEGNLWSFRRVLREPSLNGYRNLLGLVRGPVVIPVDSESDDEEDDSD